MFIPRLTDFLTSARPVSLRLLAIGVAAAIGAIAASSRGDDGDPPSFEGRIFTTNPARPGQADGKSGGGVVDLKSGTWSRLDENIISKSRASPDGRLVVSLKKEKDSNAFALYLYDVEGEREPNRLLERSGLPRCWSSDGRWLLVTVGQQQAGHGYTYETLRLSLDGKTQERLPLGETEMVDDLSPDGKRLLVTKRPLRNLDAGEGFLIPLTELVDLDGAKRTRVIDTYTTTERRAIASAHTRRFARDGQRVIYGRYAAKGRDVSLWSVKACGEDRKCLVPEDVPGYPESFCVSPDGHHIAVVFLTEERGADGQLLHAERVLSILDMNGVTLRSYPFPLEMFEIFDWRRAGK